MLTLIDRLARNWLDRREQPRERIIFPRKFRYYLWIRDNGRCQYCGKPVEPNKGWHIEHILPWSFGGPDTEDNLVVACIPCNMAKGTKIIFPIGFYELPPKWWRTIAKMIVWRI